MSSLFPNAYLISHVLITPTNNGQQQLSQHKRTPYQARTDLYPAWSVVDDAKKKANALSAEATKEFEKASSKALAKTGQIELYSAKFYAACTVGGLLACVRNSKGQSQEELLTYVGAYTYCSHPS